MPTTWIRAVFWTALPVFTFYRVWVTTSVEEAAAQGFLTIFCIQSGVDAWSELAESRRSCRKSRERTGLES